VRTHLVMAMKQTNYVAIMYFMGNKWNRVEGCFGVHSMILQTSMASKGLVASPKIHCPMTVICISIVNISQSKDILCLPIHITSEIKWERTGISAALVDGMKWIAPQSDPLSVGGLGSLPKPNKWYSIANV
jgi:hypothetical protein